MGATLHFSPKIDACISPAFTCGGGFQELKTELSGLKPPEPGGEADYNLNTFEGAWKSTIPMLL